MEWKSSIFYKTLAVLYRVNLNSNNETHKAIISSLFNTFVMIEGDIVKARLEMCLLTASGKWLDYWGDFFNIPRYENELDEDYVKRIVLEVIAPKVTIPALQQASARYTNRTEGTNYKPEDFQILEPWKQLLKLSHRGTLDGDSYLWSSDYYTQAIIDILLPEGKTLSDGLRKYLARVKAAGVQILYSRLVNWEGLIAKYYYNEHPYLYVDITQALNGDIPIVYGFMVEDPRASVVQNGPDYISKLSDTPERQLSSKQLIWMGFTRTRELPMVIAKLREFRGSSVTDLPDYSTMLQKSEADTTIQNGINLDTYDLSIQNSTGGILTYSQHSIYVKQSSNNNLVYGLANLFRDILNSPLYPFMEPYLKDVSAADLVDGRNFFYPDYKKTYYRFTSFVDVCKPLTGATPEVVTWQNIIDNPVSINNYLLKQNSIIDNVMAPVQVKRVPSSNKIYFTDVDSGWFQTANGLWNLTFDFDVSVTQESVYKYNNDTKEYEETIVDVTSVNGDITITSPDKFTGMLQLVITNEMEA